MRTLLSGGDGKEDDVAAITPQASLPLPTQGRPTRLDCATQMLLRCTLTSRKVVPAGVPTRKAIGVPAGGSLGYPLECPLECP